MRLTNPDRVFYPEQQITKLALAEYYYAIRDWDERLYRPEDLSLGRFFAGSVPREDDVTVVAEAWAGDGAPDRKRLAQAAGVGPRALGRILNLLGEVASAVDAPTSVADRVAFGKRS